jgi:hypothetical protein
MSQSDSTVVQQRPVKSPQPTTPQNTTTQVMSGSDSGKNSSTAVSAAEFDLMAEEVGKELTSADSLPQAEVKLLKGKIYNLFPNINQTRVDIGIAAYFMVNDPSPNANWGAANDIVISGKAVPAVRIAGELISMVQGDGKLRKFLSAAYEDIAPKVIQKVPNVAEILSARAASKGLLGTDPAVAVSWIRGNRPGTSSNAGARSLYKVRAVRNGAATNISNQDMAMVDPTILERPVRAGGTQQEYF